MSVTFCARDGFSVSATGGGGKWVATPTRHFRGHGKSLKCWLWGREFQTSDAAFKAMHDQGYGVEHYSRSSVPLPIFEKLAHVRRECEFDRLYRYYRWCVRHSECLFPMGRQGTPLQVQRAKLRRMAKDVGIFHPVARVFNSPRPACHGSDSSMERSMI